MERCVMRKKKTYLVKIAGRWHRCALAKVGRRGDLNFSLRDGRTGEALAGEWKTRPSWHRHIIKKAT
jgi:hypothetical protein